MNNQSNFINSLGLLIRSNKYCFGETLLFKIRSQEVFLVVISIEAGASQAKKIKDKCSFYKVPFIEVLSKQDMSLLFKKDISSFGITDKNLALKILNNYEKGGM